MIKDLYDFIVSQINTNDFFSGALIGGAILGLLNYLKAVPGIILRYLWNKMFVTITLDISDHMYKYAKEWISLLELKSIEKKFQIFTLETYDYSIDKYIYNTVLFPSAKFYYNYYEDKLIIISTNRNEPKTTDSGILSSIVYESITIKYFIWNTSLKEKILNSIISLKDSRKESGVQIYTPSAFSWEESMFIPYKSIDTVVTDNNIDVLVKDIDTFLSKRDWYSKNGITYKRGYLLYGLPGTGKTSTIHAIASKYKRPIYFVSISSKLTDTNLLDLLTKIRDNSIVVFEDIDRFIDNDKNEFSIMPILNSMDGMLAKHNILLFITANDKSKIDEALLRPGRIDLTLEYTLCTKSQLRALYILFYGTEDTVDTFLSKVEDNKYSPATIREYFMKNNTIDDCINNLEKL